jgi:YfiH family protein
MPPWPLAKIGGLPGYRSPLLAGFPELVHAFFTRRGGVSAGPYGNLNLSFAVGDDPERVAANRRRVREALQLDHLTGAAQVHGQGYAVITGGPQETGEVPQVDILLTGEPGPGLLIKQADCQAVMLYDPVRRVAANVHCGWRGQVQNVLGQAVRRLGEIFGSRPQDLRAAIGPSLGPCCAEFRYFRRELPPEFWPYQVRPTYFDLWRLSRDQLLAAGLSPAHLDHAALCTRCRTRDFYSYRRDHTTGRQGAVIALRPVTGN